MPEGDTIWRTAERLRPALDGKVLARFDAARMAVPGPPTGTTIDGVEAKGKYLFVHFGNGQTLETHMKMTGSWHLYRTGESFPRSPRSARVEIETTEGWIAVCFQAPLVELVRRRGGPEHLGPDLAAPEPDIEAAGDCADGAGGTGGLWSQRRALLALRRDGRTDRPGRACPEHVVVSRLSGPPSRAASSAFCHRCGWSGPACRRMNGRPEHLAN